MKLKVTIRNIARSPFEVRMTVTGTHRKALVKKLGGGISTGWKAWMDDVGSFLRDLEGAAYELAAESDQPVLLKVDADFVITAEPDDKR